jgi:hypothetical protein
MAENRPRSDAGLAKRTPDPMHHPAMVDCCDKVETSR